jgi:hypothetical protein
MNISGIKFVWKTVIGFLNPWGNAISSAAGYLREVLNGALAKIDPKRKDNIQAALNIANRVLSVLVALKWLCPTKWQTAYAATIAAVTVVVNALQDLQLTTEELVNIRNDFNAAVIAWNGDDDETCIDCID